MILFGKIYKQCRKVAAELDRGRLLMEAAFLRPFSVPKRPKLSHLPPALSGKIDFNGFFPWADDPILRDAAGRIDVFLCRLSFLAVLGCSGGHRHHPAPDQLLPPFFLICQITAQCKGLLLPLLYAKFSGKLTCTHSFPL